MKKSALATVLALTVFALLALPVQADYLYDRSGTLISVDGSVLGEDDAEVEIEKTEEGDAKFERVTPAPDPRTTRSELEMKREAQRREEAKKRSELLREKAKQQLEQQIETRQRLNEKNQLKSRLEIKTEEGKFKLKQEITDRAGNTTKKEVELKAGESLHVESEDGERTEIKPIIQERQEERQEERREQFEEKKEERIEKREQKLELIRNQVRTETQLPLSVGPDNELIITRPDGTTKVVTVLPDQAVENLRNRGIVLDDPTVAPELTENSRGDLVYRLEREEERRLLGLRLKFRRTTEVSAETGEITTISQETNPVKRWLESLVF